ncbi:MAG TPA: hypothetical protein PLL30_03065 [Candidatus Krumholzibacteria bacterium]|nr:hypothetical protein [Candidatus Krumholzibacteria bacterium]HPD70752.1 hypothetical protein [Candidatus Krumholzibacteria bacterium]HRY39548.1 hypothetical protein [Candidatus Krumholzibacteria bacterium]
MSTRALQRQLIENLREWQKLEHAQITLTGSVMELTSNPIVTLIMQIVQRDSEMHHRVQQLIIDSLESTVVGLTQADVDLVRDKLAAHLAMEKETVRLAEASLAALAGHELMIQEILMTFLRRDEEKHQELLAALDGFLEA